MSFTSGKSVVKKHRQGNQPPVLKCGYVPAHVPQFTVKLKKMPGYEKIPDDDLTGLVEDLTSSTKMRQSYFATHEDSQPNSPYESLLSPQTPPSSEEKVPAGRLSVKVILELDPQGRRRHPAIAIHQPHCRGGTCVCGAETTQSVLEEEYARSLCKASLQVNDQVLIWGPESVIIPYGRPIQYTSLPGETEMAQAGDTDLPQDSEVFQLEHCSADKLQKCLNVVTRYNKRLYFDEATRNSHHFIQEAVEALGLKEKSPLRYNEYLEALAKEKNERVPTVF